MGRSKTGCSGGAGGVGHVAIQLAKSRGATVYATCGGAEKVKLCESLGADVAIDYTSEDFQAVVLGLGTGTTVVSRTRTVAWGI